MSWVEPGSTSDSHSGEAVRIRDGLDVAAGFAVLAGVPGVDLLACDAGGLLGQSIGGEQFAVQDQVCHAVGFGLAEHLVQVRCVLGEHRDDLVEVAVARCPGDAVVAGQCGDVDVLAEPTQAQHGLVKACQRAAAATSAPQVAFSFE